MVVTGGGSAADRHSGFGGAAIIQTAGTEQHHAGGRLQGRAGVKSQGGQEAGSLDARRR